MDAKIKLHQWHSENISILSQKISLSNSNVCDIIILQELDCDQSNVGLTPRALLSHLFTQSCFLTPFPSYRRSVSHHPLRNVSNLQSYGSTVYSVRGQNIVAVYRVGQKNCTQLSLQ